MKKIIALLLSLILVAAVAMPVSFAVTGPEANKQVRELFEGFESDLITKADTNGDGKVRAIDAREILLAGAWLSDNEVAKNADLDGDGMVTAIDARLALRYAAGLVTPTDIALRDNDAKKLEVFNKIMNSVKPNAEEVRCAYNTKCENIEITNGAALDDLSKQMNKLTDGSENVDMRDELMKQKGTVSYTNPRNFTATAGTNYPILDPASSADSMVSSLLTADNIQRIEYKTNQSVSFIRQQYVNNKEGGYDTTKPPMVNARVDLQGLDAITVYVKDDPSLKSIPSPQSKLNAGKVFTVPTQKDLQDSIDQIANDIKSVKTMLDELFEQVGSVLGSLVVTKKVVDASTTLKTISFENSYVTLYFNPKTGKPVYTDYSLSYKYDMNFYLNMNIQIPIKSIYIKVDKQNIGIKQTIRDTKTFLFTNYEKEFEVK